MGKIGIIIKREYLTRVVKKSFLVMTIIGPVLMAALMIGPAYLAKMDKEDTKEVLVIDQTGAFQKSLKIRIILFFTMFLVIWNLRRRMFWQKAICCFIFPELS